MNSTPAGNDLLTGIIAVGWRPDIIPSESSCADARQAAPALGPPRADATAVRALDCGYCCVVVTGGTGATRST